MRLKLLGNTVGVEAVAEDIEVSIVVKKTVSQSCGPVSMKIDKIESRSLENSANVLGQFAFRACQIGLERRQNNENLAARVIGFLDRRKQVLQAAFGNLRAWFDICRFARRIKII